MVDERIDDENGADPAIACSEALSEEGWMGARTGLAVNMTAAMVAVMACAENGRSGAAVSTVAEVRSGPNGGTWMHMFAYEGGRLRRVDTRDESGGLIAERVYTVDGNRIDELQYRQLVDNRTETTKFTYEGAKLVRMELTTDDFTKVTTLEYDGDLLSMVSSRKTEDGGNVVSHLFEYRYDSDSRLERQSQTIENRDLNYEGTNILEFDYDAMGLIRSTTSYIPGADPLARTYSYDAEDRVAGIEAANDVRWSIQLNAEALVERVEFTSLVSETLAFTYEEIDVDGVFFVPPFPGGEMFDMRARSFDVPTPFVLDLRGADRSTFIPNQPDAFF